MHSKWAAAFLIVLAVGLIGAAIARGLQFDEWLTGELRTPLEKTSYFFVVLALLGGGLWAFAKGVYKLQDDKHHHYGAVRDEPFTAAAAESM